MNNHNHRNAPEVINTFGFRNAPFSKGLLMITGAGSLASAIFSVKHKILLNLYWNDIIRNKQLWRLFTSQIVYQNSFNFITSCMMIYNFLALERRMGTCKYVSFTLFSWSMSLVLYLSFIQSKHIQEFVPHCAYLPSGLYGPLFSMLVVYVSEIPSSDKSEFHGFPLSRKMIMYLLALQMLLTDRRTSLICSCGMISGIIYKFNALHVQEQCLGMVSWMKKILTRFGTLLGVFGSSPPAPVYRTTFMGATDVEQDDMIFNYFTQRQQERMMGRVGSQGQHAMGQGYSDVLSPSLAYLFGNNAANAAAARNPRADIQRADIQRADIQHISNPTLMGNPADVDMNNAQVEDTAGLEQPGVHNGPPVVEEKLEELLAMGFDRDSIVHALLTTDNDTEAAINILLSS